MKKLITKQSAIIELAIANEDMSNIIKHIYTSGVSGLTSFSNQLQSIIPNAIAALKELNVPKETVPELNKNKSSFIQLVDKYPYSEVKELKAFKPEGLGVSYLQFLDVLDSEINHVLKLEKEILDPYCTYLAKLVSLPEEIKALDTKQNTYKNINDRRESATAVLSKCYKKDSYEAITTVVNVVDRNRDWSIIINRLNSSIYNINKIDKKSIEEKVKLCEQYLDVLYDKYNKQELSNITPEVIKAITDSTYQVAKEIEFFAALYFRVLTLKGSVENTIEHITKVYK